MPDYKTFTLDPEHVKADVERGVVDAYVAIFGIIDLGADRMWQGSFSKTLQDRGDEVIVLDNHNAHSIMGALGTPLLIEERPRDQLPAEILGRYPDVSGGLFTRTQFLMDTPEGEGAFIRLRDKAVRKWSFAYDPMGYDFTTLELPSGIALTVRELREVKLYEYSPVLFPMNEATSTVGAKSLAELTLDEWKTVSGSTGFPLASRERRWDRGAAERRVRAWAGVKDEPNARYRSAHFWYDRAEADNFGSYKLLFADVIDGEIHAIPRAVFAVAGVLQGARGGVDIPEDDVRAVRSRVARYYARMRSELDDENIIPPWDKRYEYLRDFIIAHSYVGRPWPKKWRQVESVLFAGDAVPVEARRQAMDAFDELIDELAPGYVRAATVPPELMGDGPPLDPDVKPAPAPELEVDPEVEADLRTRAQRLSLEIQAMEVLR